MKTARSFEYWGRKMRKNCSQVQSKASCCFICV